MDIDKVIIGAVVTEKAERLKAQRTYTLKVANGATKVDVKAALRKFYDLTAVSVRTMRTTTKTREFGSRRATMVKRAPFKKVLITLAPKSKPLDIAAFK